jgi:hypothetical protein
MLQELTGDGTSVETRSLCRDRSHPRAQALLRLLVVELAMRNYQLERGRLPSTLNELVPHYLEELPRDPFDAAAPSFRYVVTTDRFKLSSAGPWPFDGGGFWPADDGGELRLETHFAPDDDSAAYNGTEQ